MSAKRDSGSFGLASYLSPNEIRALVRLTSKIKSAKKIDEVLRYQKQLAFLMAKAERNKKVRERIVRQHASALKEIDRDQIAKRYLSSQMRSTSTDAEIPGTPMTIDPGEGFEFAGAELHNFDGSVVRFKNVTEALESAGMKAVRSGNAGIIKGKVPEVSKVYETSGKRKRIPCFRVEEIGWWFGG